MATRVNRKAGRPRGRIKGQRRRAQDPRAVTDPLTPQELGRETRKSTNLRFRPLEREIGAEIKASRQRGKAVGNWWNQYLDEVTRGRSEVQAAYDQAGSSAAAQMAQAGQIDSANTQRLNAEEAASAALRGVDPSTAPSQREAAMAAQRNTLAAAQAGSTAQLGANQYAYLTDQRRIGAGQKIAARIKEQDRGLSFRRDRTAVRRERGDYAATKRSELRDSEFDKQVQRKAFNLDKQEADQRASESAQDLRLREREGDRDQDQRDRELNQEGARIRNEDKGDGGGRYTQAERNDLRAERRNAYAAATSYYKAAGSPDYTAAEWNKLIALVAEETGVGYAIAKQAVNRLRRG